MDQTPTFVPNGMIADRELINYSRRPGREIRFTLGLTYESTHAQLVQIKEKIQTYINESGEFLTKNLSFVLHYQQFSASSIDMDLVVFTPVNDINHYRQVHENLLLEIKRTAEDSGTAFACPTVQVRGMSRR